MTRLDPKIIMMRSKCAWDIRDMWGPVLQDAYELSLPSRNPYDTTEGPRSLSRQFDSTAANSVIRAANRLQTELTPPDYTWPSLTAGPLMELEYSKEDIESFKKYLESFNKIIALTFMSGAFINAIWEVYIDLLIAGMGVMLVLENPDVRGEPAITQAVSQAEIAIDENGRGEVSGVYRKRKKFKARNIASLWDDAKLPKALRDMIDGKDSKNKAADPEIELLECTYEGPDGIYYYEVLWVNGGSPVRIVEREYSTNPWIIFRWSKLPGIPYGPGPVLMALADIRTANAIIEMMLKNAAMALGGVYLARDDGVLNPNNILVTPGTIIPVNSTREPPLIPLETGRNFSVAIQILEQLQASIKKALFDNALPPAESTVRSPTEIMQRVKELTQDIGGNIGRLTTDLVSLVKRVADIKYRKGLIPVNLKIDQFTLKVQINSPLARTQQFSEVQTYIDWIQMVSSMGGPQAVMLAAEVEKGYGWIAEKLGVPKELIRDEASRTELQKKMAAIAATQMGAQPAVNGAGAAPPPQTV